MSALTNLLAAGLDDAQYVTYLIVSIVFIVLMFIAALTAIILVLLQQSNSDGIQSITGSSETFFGKNKGQSIESKLKKWSWICLAVLGVLSVIFFVVQIIAP
jgi:preprotein translocase subunit SecG